VDLESLTRTSGEWLRGTGPESDIVMSSRIRLARNLAQFPFPSRCSDSSRAEIEALLRQIIERLPLPKPLYYFRLDNLETLDRQFLVERQLISRELAESHGHRGVGISESETISLMVNEEDHLRMQVLRSGLALDECWQEIDAIDDAIEAEVNYAFSEQLGYLTSCPTNVGTGIRVSVLLHLPALVITKEVQKVFQALQKIGLAVRGLYGEGSQAMGDFYQISNQATLGMSEEDLIKKVKDVVPNILAYERRARNNLVKENRQSLHDQVSRAYGNLRHAQTISSEETMHLLSSVRMGVNLGLIDDIEIPTINELFILTQPAHLQKLRHERLESAERNVVRASYIRQRVADVHPSSHRGPANNFRTARGRPEGRPGCARRASQQARRVLRLAWVERRRVSAVVRAAAADVAPAARTVAVPRRGQPAEFLPRMVGTAAVRGAAGAHPRDASAVIRAGSLAERDHAAARIADPRSAVHVSQHVPGALSWAFSGHRGLAGPPHRLGRPPHASHGQHDGSLADAAGRRGRLVAADLDLSLHDAGVSRSTGAL
jgi:protein arginine kinase